MLNIKHKTDLIKACINKKYIFPRWYSHSYGELLTNLHVFCGRINRSEEENMSAKINEIFWIKVITKKGRTTERMKDILWLLLLSILHILVSLLHLIKTFFRWLFFMKFWWVHVLHLVQQKNNLQATSFSDFCHLEGMWGMVTN